MSKKITLYELLGLIKDGKRKPEKIKFNSYVYVYRAGCKDYYNDYIGWLFNDSHRLTSILDVTVEIVEKIEYRKDKITTVKYIGEGSFIEKGSYGVLLENDTEPLVKWLKDFTCCYDTYINGEFVENVWAVSLDNLELVSVIDK